MSLDTMEALLVEQLRDIYYAEKQLVAALPRMAKAASNAELKQAFTDHAGQTAGHVARLEQAFEVLGITARGKKCQAIDGLMQEAAELMAEKGTAAVKDAGIIASAQRVEHYEIAAYGNLKVFADAMGRDDIAALMETTLEEEHVADALLTEITGGILPAALGAGQEEEDALMTGTVEALTVTAPRRRARDTTRAGKSTRRRSR